MLAIPLFPWLFVNKDNSLHCSLDTDFAKYLTEIDQS